jgi:hypothetical protein
MMQVSPADFRLIEKIEWLFINNREKYPEYFLLKTGAKKIDSSKRGNVLYGISTHTTLAVQYPSGLVSADVVIKEKTNQEAMEEAENEMYEALEFEEFDEEFLPDVSGNTSGRILKILCYRDPSTKKTYISFVPGEINKADTAMAWKFHLTRAEYDTLYVEA